MVFFSGTWLFGSYSLTDRVKSALGCWSKECGVNYSQISSTEKSGIYWDDEKNEDLSLYLDVLCIWT